MKRLLSVMLVLGLLAGIAPAAHASDGIGLRLNFSPWGRYSANSQSNGQSMSYGVGLQWEKDILKLIGLGAMGMMYFPKEDITGANRDKAWALMMYGKLYLPLIPVPMISTYLIAELGVGQYVPSHGDNFMEMPMGGGLGAEFNLGPLGVFLDIDYLYRQPLQKISDVKLKWHGLGINVGAMFNL